MRLFCELFLVAVLIWLGWSQSFHDRFDRIRGVEPAANVASKPEAGQTSVATVATAPAPRQPFVPRYAPARPAPTLSNGDWMWDPGHRNPLDPGALSGSEKAQHQANQNYWIDSRGVRHSANATPPPPGASP